MRILILTPFTDIKKLLKESPSMLDYSVDTSKLRICVTERTPILSASSIYSEVFCGNRHYDLVIFVSYYHLFTDGVSLHPPGMGDVVVANSVYEGEARPWGNALKDAKYWDMLPTIANAPLCQSTELWSESQVPLEVIRTSVEPRLFSEFGARNICADRHSAGFCEVMSEGSTPFLCIGLINGVTSFGKASRTPFDIESSLNKKSANYVDSPSLFHYIHTLSESNFLHIETSH